MNQIMIPMSTYKKRKPKMLFEVLAILLVSISCRHQGNAIIPAQTQTQDSVSCIEIEKRDLTLVELGYPNPEGDILLQRTAYVTSY